MALNPRNELANLGGALTVECAEVRIPCGDAVLFGDLALPPRFSGLVLFAHGSGSGRHSARNRQVAKALQNAGIGTLLFDLLTTAEERADIHTGEHRFDIALLTRRMQDTTLWVIAQPQFADTPIGYFGASTGSAAALIAAARLGTRVSAVVSRGGRPDLAGPVVLASLKAPTLLIVGGDDHGVIELNEQAYQHIQCEKQLTLVPGAAHLFEEHGALEQVSALATSWFQRHLHPTTHSSHRPAHVSAAARRLPQMRQPRESNK
jgi:putative phosphoribosyl transferase